MVVHADHEKHVPLITGFTNPTTNSWRPHVPYRLPMANAKVLPLAAVLGLQFPRTRLLPQP